MAPESRPSRMDSYTQLADEGIRDRDTSDVYGDDEYYKCCCSGRMNRRDEDDTLEYKAVGKLNHSVSGVVAGLYYKNLTADEIAKKVKMSREQVLAIVRQNKLRRK